MGAKCLLVFFSGGIDLSRMVRSWAKRRLQTLSSFSSLNFFFPRILTAWKSWKNRKPVCRRFKLNQNLAFIAQSFTFHFCFHKATQFWFSEGTKKQLCQIPPGSSFSLGKREAWGVSTFSTTTSLSQVVFWPGHASHHHQQVIFSWDKLPQQFSPTSPTSAKLGVIFTGADPGQNVGKGERRDERGREGKWEDVKEFYIVDTGLPATRRNGRWVWPTDFFCTKKKKNKLHRLSLLNSSKIIWSSTCEEYLNNHVRVS